MSVERSELNVERSAPRGAVFLSYASQDAEAAKRICDALRAAGVEVWFDQSELVGGDAWDQKIRKQIKECALLIPIISAATQARREGYFRLEWRLADQRTHLMAKGLPFLLPGVIDDTRDTDAHVPDSFTEVQWTRLPGGETPPSFALRVQKLLAGDGGRDRLIPSGPRDERGGIADPALHKKPRPWLVPAVAGLVAIAALALWQPWRRPAGGVEKPGATAAAQPVSAARELADKARALILELEATREDFALAEDLCQRALKLDPTDGEVWAAYAQLCSAYGYRGWDPSPERREQTRVMAERAIRLAPTSVQARLAQAGAWSGLGVNRPETEKLLRDIVREQPTNQPALRFLAVTVLNHGALDECLALNERSAALPGGDPLALHNNARYLWQHHRPAEAYATLQRALAQRSFPSALTLKTIMELTWRGDPAAAEATLRQIPQSGLLDDRLNYIAGLVPFYQRKADAALAAWGAFPRDYYVDFVYDGPKGLLIGLADEFDERDVAAKIKWRTALQAVEKRLAATPNNGSPYYYKAYLLACLGDKAAAEEALLTCEQLWGIKYPPGSEMSFELALVYARLRRFDEIFAHPPKTSRMKTDPRLDALRADPRYPAMIATVSAALPSSRPQTPAPADSAIMDEKSVAVLAFANLSDDKGNEYFSDGISEELLNVLAKVPGLKVTARTSSFHFKGKDTPIPEIAKQLGVAYVVEGSVRKQGDKVRITAQLIKAADGFHVWSDTFTRDVKDIFAVQDEIAGLISENLQLKLAATARRAVVSPAAYSLLLQGRFFAQRESNEGRIQSVAYYRQAIAREPAYALAWGEMARDFAMLGRYGGLPIREAMQEARAAAQRALELNPDEPYGLNALGWVQRLADWDWRGARKSFERAVALAPDNPTTLGDAAVLLFNIGLTDEAIALARRGVERDPLSARAHFSLGDILSNADRVAESVEAYSRGIDLAPNTEVYRAIRGMALSRLRRSADAITSLKQEPNEFYQLVAQALVARDQGDQVASVKARDELIAKTGNSMAGWVAVIFAHQGESDRAFAWMERAAQERDRMVPWTKGLYYLRSLHTDPRWPEFLRKLGLTDEQLK